MKAIKASLTIQRFNLDIPFSEKPIYVFACVHAFKCTALTIVACNILPTFHLGSPLKPQHLSLNSHFITIVVDNKCVALLGFKFNT